MKWEDGEKLAAVNSKQFAFSNNFKDEMVHNQSERKFSGAR